MKLTSIAFANIRHSLKKYAMFFFAMCFCVFTTYSFISLSFSENVLGKIQSSSSYQSIFIGFGIVILVFILFFLISSNNSFIRARKKEISMYALFGMQNSKIGLLMFYETMILGLIALAAGILLGVFFSKLLVMILLKMVMAAYSGNITFVIEAKPILITALIYLSIFSLMGLSGLRVINKFQLVDLFKSDKVSESKNKGSITMLIISFILIMGGYWLAVMPNPGAVVIFMIPITIIEIIGTYLFFHGGFQKVLQILKRNKKSFYKKTNLIPLSLLSHRSTTMATMMATISVLVAIGTTAMAFGYVLYENTALQAYDANSFGVYYITDGAAVTDDVYEVFDQHGVDITDEITFQQYVSHPVLENTTDAYNNFFNEDTHLITYSQSTYDQILEKTKGTQKEITVKPGEVAVLYPNFQDDIESDGAILNLDGYTLNATFEKTNNTYNFGGMLLTLVLNDRDFDTLVKSGAVVPELGGTSYSTLTGINYEGALKSPEVAAALAEVFEGRTARYQLVFQKYNDILGYFGLLCFIGFFMCAVFILMTASLLYFKQITIATEEKSQYEMLRKIGMNTDEENKVIAKRLKPIFFFPLILGIIHSIFAMKGADTLVLTHIVVTDGSTYLSALGTSLVMYAAYTFVYTLFYFITKGQYKQAIK